MCKIARCSRSATCNVKKLFYSLENIYILKYIQLTLPKLVLIPFRSEETFNSYINIHKNV